ncbi:Aste57867_12201 [Aphanomyces stellatus]|uniref:peptidylprolyl isomerase n=1 Tax=Aphanomyces stellatus TaxID=120398 RepID=A0A485KVQ1_9STRA|nr:hypothetical protein As57867_012156 [Aphanomyces stellatus]VFT89055.1 Aste57867_12201 [Aphanomyces stellatus]
MVEEGFEDVLGTGAIRKKSIKTSDGKKAGMLKSIEKELSCGPLEPSPSIARVSAQFGDEVIMTYSSYDLETDKKITDDTQVAFRIGDNETFAVLELMGRVMRVGEVVQVHCESRFAYGNVGEEVEKDESLSRAVKFIISLDEWVAERKMPDEMTNDELIVEANKKKESGNRWFNQKNYAYAINCYKKALKVLEQWDTDEDFSKNEPCKQLVVALGNNVANVQCKLGKYKEAKDSCREVLQAWYRLAQMAYQQGDCAEATSYIREALAIDPTNKAIRELVPLVKEKREHQKQRDKKLYAKLGESKPPAPTATESTTTASSSASLNAWVVASVVVVAVAAVAISQYYSTFVAPTSP